MTKHITIIITIIALFLGATMSIPAKAQSSLKWQPSSWTDKMTGKVSPYLTKKVSIVEGNWNFPYGGTENTAKLIYTCEEPRLYISFSDTIPYKPEWTGRISYDGKVEPTKLYRSDGGRALFLSDYNRRVIEEEKYKKIKIELAAQQDGTIYLTFNVEGAKEIIATHCK